MSGKIYKILQQKVISVTIIIIIIINSNYDTVGE